MYKYITATIKDDMTKKNKKGYYKMKYKVIELQKELLKEFQKIDFTSKTARSQVLKLQMKNIEAIEKMEVKEVKEVKKENKKDKAKKDLRFALVVNGANIKELGLANVQNILAYNFRSKDDTGSTYKTVKPATAKDVDNMIACLLKEIKDGKPYEAIEIHKTKKIVKVK
jgi:hypothetical protein